MRVFVTGATGFVGQEVVRQAREGGHSVRILVRNSQPRSTNASEIHVGDVLDARTLEGALGDIEAIIHLVGIISEVGRHTFENIHALGTRNMVEAAQRSGVKRFLHMSALGTRAGAVSRYHQSKWAAEETVRQSGLDYSIFRPSLIYGPGDHFVNLFAKMAKFSPVLPIMGAGNARFQPVAVEVVASAFIRALKEPRANHQTFDLCGPQTMTLPQILDEIMAATGRKRWKVYIPMALARCQAALLELFYGQILKQAPPLNRDQLLMLQEDNVGDRSKAEDLFGLTQTPFQEGIRSYLRGSDSKNGTRNTQHVRPQG